MVDPVSDDDRQAFARKVKAGFVLLVALSAGLTTLQIGSGPVGFLIAGGAGAIVGILLLWVAFPDMDDLGSSDRTRWRDQK